MSRTLADALRWAETGSKLFVDAVASLSEEATDWDAETLPGWTRRHLVAHLAANADALGNLVTWATTGIETPMYASPEARAAGIAKGDELAPAELVAWLARAIDALDTGMAALTSSQWETRIRTAQGRLVPAAEIPWLRAREVCVHAVDLATGVRFADLPDDFLDALVADISAKRGAIPVVDGPLPEIAAWLAGRPHHLTEAPALGPWL